MDSERSNDTPEQVREEPKIKVTPQNWRQVSQHIHDATCERMELEKGTLTELVFLALAMGGEKEGVANEVKKIWRDGGTEEAYRKVAMECADVLIYMDHILGALNVSATQICIMKLQELVERWPHLFEDWQPEGTAVN